MFVKLVVLSRKLYWFILRPRTTGVKCLIRYDGKILLIRNSYNPDVWTLVGGGVKRSEELKSAIKREVMEEVGLKLENVSLIGKYGSNKEYKKDTVHCFYGELTSPPIVKASRKEVAEAKWVNQKNLPKNISSSVTNSLEMLSTFLEQEESTN